MAPVNFSSPNYPQGYPHNLQCTPCQWIITSSLEGESVHCTFVDFDTEVNYDVVTVCDGGFCCPSSILATLSGGAQSAPVVSSTSSSLTVSLLTDGTVSRRGFSERTARWRWALSRQRKKILECSRRMLKPGSCTSLTGAMGFL